jgi:hypothetical protein
MKKLTLTLTAIIFSISLFAQDNAYFPKEGTTLVSKATVKSPMGEQEMYTVQTAKYDDNKIVLNAKIYSKLGDEQPIQSLSYTYNVSNDNISIALQDMLKEQIEQMGDLEIIKASDDYVLPKELEIGKEYPEAYLELKGKVQGMDMELTMAIKNRKAECKETIEVPAGKFECIKYSESIIVNAMGQEIATDITTWYSEGVGPVKQVVESMGGMVTNTSELIEIK